MPDINYHNKMIVNDSGICQRLYIEDIPFTSQSCASCGHSVWGYENGKIVCCVCGHTMADMRKEAENE